MQRTVTLDRTLRTCPVIVLQYNETPIVISPSRRRMTALVVMPVLYIGCVM